MLGVSPPSGGQRLDTSGGEKVDKRQSKCRTKKPREWLVIPLVLKLRTEMIARLETRIKSRTNEFPPEVSPELFLLTCFLLWH